MNAIKAVISFVFKDHAAALAAHVEQDKVEFESIRSERKDAEIRFIEALKENIGYLREDIRDYKMATDDRFSRMERVHQDLLFRYLDKKDKAG